MNFTRRNRPFYDSDAIFEMSIWQCIMVYSGYMNQNKRGTEQHDIILYVVKSYLVVYINFFFYKMGVNDRCAVGQCNNARKYPEKFVIKPHILAFDTSLHLRFGNVLVRSYTLNGHLHVIERTLNLGNITLFARIILSMANLLMSVLYQRCI